MKKDNMINDVESTEDFFKGKTIIDAVECCDARASFNQIVNRAGLPVELVLAVLDFAGVKAEESEFGPAYDREVVVKAFKDVFGLDFYLALSSLDNDFIYGEILAGVEVDEGKQKTLRELQDANDSASAVAHLADHDFPRVSLTGLEKESGLPKSFLQDVFRETKVQFLAGEDEPEFYRHEVWEAFYKNFRPDAVPFIHPMKKFLFGNN